MTNSGSENASILLEFSNNLADIVEESGRSVIEVNGRRRMSSSGVHWRQGIIVTTDHALSREEEIIVTLPNEQTITATLIGRDSSTDLAVLKTPEIELPVANLADATTLKVGHLVLAIARSSDNGLSASLGVISTLGGTWRTWGGGRIDQFIRPSLMLYPGFSGGPLVDTQGRVVGINTIAPRHVTLTIPTVTVNRIIDQLLQTGSIKRGYLGLGMQPVQLPESLTRSLNLSTNGGVLIVSIEPNAPADKAGVLIGDILVALNGNSINDVSDVHDLLDPEKVGQPLTAQIIRGGNLMEVTIIVGSRPKRGC